MTVEGMKIVDLMSYRITIGDKCRDMRLPKSRFTERVANMLEWGTVLLKIRSNHNRRMETILVAIWNYQERKEIQSVDSVTC